jgi:lipopolysaccharide transport system permease protein
MVEEKVYVGKNLETAPVEQKEHWTEIIQPYTKLLDLRLGEVWRYRDLVMMFVRRDFVSNYKQTILGPIWFFLQPLLTALTYVLIFGKAAGLAPEGLPPVLFYLSGITIWNYFSECLSKTATVFKDNAQMFGKVYFPRLTMPVSITISNLVRFGIQLLLFVLIWVYFLATTTTLQPNLFLLLVPFLVVLMGAMALGLGMIISAMTTKYKDLIFLLTFGIQLAMYATPVIIPIQRIPEKYQWIIKANPVTSIVETFRYAFTGFGEVNWGLLSYSFVFTIVILILGTIVFNKVEKGFTDTV